MAKLFPETVSLKKAHCPECKAELKSPVHSEVENLIRAVCSKTECGYRIDLCWLGDVESLNN